MTKLRNSIRLYAAIAVICISVNIQAQVTIGSETPPVKGAILQLSEGDITSRGLGMPRIKLTNLEDIGVDIPEAAGNEAIHTGLLVYNVNEDLCASNPIYKGLYVWDGDNWKILRKSKEDYLIFVDQDNNSFKARSFGDAGIWMIENLKAKTFAGTANGALPTLSGASSTSIAYYCYPNTVTVEPTSPNNEGLLYNWAAVSNYYIPADGSINQNQVDNTTPGPLEVENKGPNGPDSKGEFYVQGICPNDWHVPSDREWNELEKEIYTNADIYSTYTDSDLPFESTSWQTSWEYILPTTQGVSRGTDPEGHGLAMLTQCPPSNNKGRSLPAAQGGFDVLPVGFVIANSAYSYGTLTYLWSSSYYDNGSSITSNIINRLLSNGVDPAPSTVRKIAFGRNNMNSLRCKKND